MKLEKFKKWLEAQERSAATVEKYTRDVRRFFCHIGDEEVTRKAVLEYKCYLGAHYAATGANSMIAALNCYFRYIERPELCVKQLRVQRQAYCSEERELTRAEYRRLVDAARSSRNERLSLMIQTICGTGIRVSELQFITVEAVRAGEAVVSCKGKKRRIFIVSELKKKLLRYLAERGIRTGAVFITRGGVPVSRHAIWREMKKLCARARVAESKVFPHNLRHLFARTFYSLERDIVKLADILGHASINTTRIYTVTSGKEHRRRMENMRLII